MPQTTSRVQKKLLQERLENGSFYLGSVLNGGSDSPSPNAPNAELILRFVKAYKELDEALHAVPPRTHANTIYALPRVVAAFDELNLLLSRYKLTPILHAYRGSDTRLLPGWQMYWGEEWMSQPSQEFRLIQIIEMLAVARKLSSIKQCSNCKRWLVAQFSHQRFCSDACKEAFHRSDPADKQRRRDWARKNYQLHKTKNVK